MVGPAVQREAVAHLRAVTGLWERRACALVGADRKMIRYLSRRPAEAELRARLRELANERRRFGYRRLFILLRREGERSGKNRIYRLYREEGLTVRKRKARRRAVGTRAPIVVEAKANARWSLDFVHDQFASGRRFRILNVVDDVTRECLAAIPDASIPGRRVARELTALVQRRGKPGLIVSDNGAEFTSNAVFSRVTATMSPGISSRRESRCKTGSARVSTVACATSFSTKPYSLISTMPGRKSRAASTITTVVARIRRSATSLPPPTRPTFPQHAIGCATQGECKAFVRPDQLRRPHVAPPAPYGVKSAETLIAAG